MFSVGPTEQFEFPFLEREFERQSFELFPAVLSVIILLMLLNPGPALIPLLMGLLMLFVIWWHRVKHLARHLRQAAIVVVANHPMPITITKIESDAIHFAVGSVELVSMTSTNDLMRIDSIQLPYKCTAHLKPGSNDLLAFYHKGQMVWILGFATCTTKYKFIARCLGISDRIGVL